ncbi:MAG: sigma-70 family RNA polymerase sigma factor [Planctomycetaceae bacterium]|nr:sigma-70 family RNA polymerase sigma factor [Planctomycetaceae bacterium]
MTSPEFIQQLTKSQSRIYAYILSLVFDADQAEDILQQTNAVLWEKADDFQLGTNFIAWSFRIAWFQVLAFRKRKSRDRLVFDDVTVSEVAAAAEQVDEQFELKHRLLRGCLEQLNDRQRDCVRRRYQAESSLQSIAEEMGLKANAVKQLLFRARNALNRCVRAKISQGAS